MGTLASHNPMIGVTTSDKRTTSPVTGQSGKASKHHSEPQSAGMVNRSRGEDGRIPSNTNTHDLP